MPLLRVWHPARGGEPMIEVPVQFDTATRVVESMIHWVKLALDTAGIVVITIGALFAFAALPGAIRGERRFTLVRLDFARYLGLTLEFQLAADVIETALAPTWEGLGQLAIIATIRTMLNYFLGREMREERATVAESTHGDGAASDVAVARSSR